MAKSIGFMVGDWIIYGEKRYGEKYTEAIKRSGLTMERLELYSHVARRIEMLNRSNVLDFTHHVVAARLKDPDQQQHWL